MAETSEKTGEKKLSVTPTKTLTLKGRSVEQGVVRQSFSHGRTKAVVVEKVKSRVPGKTRPDAAPPTPVAPSRTASGRAAAPTAAPAPTTPQPAPKPSGVVLRTLTEEERSARARALGDARLREAEERKIAEEEARIQKERDEIERVEREAAEARKADEEKRRKHDAETKRKADEVVKKHFGGEATPTATPTTPPLRAPGPRPALEAEEEEA
ncbi:MAG: translation initiation factor IF-2 associated domain-containing protein, partial [Xanthobacteraceae bacterium]